MGTASYGTAHDIQTAIEDITGGLVEHKAQFGAFRAQLTGSNSSATDIAGATSALVSDSVLDVYGSFTLVTEGGGCFRSEGVLEVAQPIQCIAAVDNPAPGPHPGSQRHRRRNPILSESPPGHTSPPAVDPDGWTCSEQLNLTEVPAKNS